MISFEKKLKKRIKMKLIGTIAIDIFILTAFIIKLNQVENVESIDSWYIGIFIGMFIGTTAVSYKQISSYYKAIRDPKLLKQLQIKENDERNLIITIRTCKSCVYISIATLGILGIITAFFNQIISLTIVIIMILILILYILLWIYNSKKI